jgi:hypothetical protein
MTVRLLLPPGICVCKLTSPAARHLAALLGGDAPAPTPVEEDDDDHAPGCPASPLAAGMGVSPPSGPSSPDLDPGHLALGLVIPPALLFAPPGPCDRPLPHPKPSIDPIYLTVCALLI